MPKVTINGSTFEAETQESLDKAIEIYGKGVAAAAPPKSSNKRARPTLKVGTPVKPEEIKAMTVEEFKEGLKNNPSGTILALVNEALGFDMKMQLGRISVAAGTAMRDQAQTAATLALNEQGLEVNDKNIKEFLDAAQVEMGENFATSLLAFRTVAATAKENEWFDAAPTSDEKTTIDEKSTNVEAKEQKLDTAARTAIEGDFEQVSDEKLSAADVKKLEKGLADMSEQDFSDILSMEQD